MKSLNEKKEGDDSQIGLHKKIKDFLGLKKLGFKSECLIGDFRVDELHEELAFVVEINGNYPHANPKKYKADDEIYLRGKPKQIASELWEKDKEKLAYLKAQGYEVFVIWESDSLDAAKEKFVAALENRKRNKQKYSIKNKIK
jgi:very-short-patch-repair endonuclease